MKKQIKNNIDMETIKPIQFKGVDNKRPIIIAGPCSAETEEQVMSTATDLAKALEWSCWRIRVR